jgi:hypothetical protein
MWLWIGIGLGAFLAVSVVIGVVIAAVLGSIGRDITHLHDEIIEGEAWAMWPPTRATSEDRAEQENEARLR